MISTFIKKIYYFYARIFSRNIFSRINNLLFNLSLRGLGIYNYQNMNISGEVSFLKKYIKSLPDPIIFDIGANKGDYALEILESVGATKPVRDGVDARIIADFDAGTGTYKEDVVYPDDFPAFQDIPPPADTDNDGMADPWELSEGSNVGVDDSAGDLDGDGYTNIEEYLYYLMC